MSKRTRAQWKGSSVEARVETITPEIAEEYLRLSGGNRNIVRSAVETYVEMIKAGKWDINNNGIGFNQKGVLIDGHHRLTAIVIAGQPVTCLVVRGLAESSIDHIDIGTSRNVGHILHMGYNELNGAKKASIASSLNRIEFNKAPKMTIDRYREAVARHEKGFKWMSEDFGLSKGRNIPADARGALVYAYPVMPQKVAAFAAALADDDAAHHPAVRACIRTLVRTDLHSRRYATRDVGFRVLRCLLAYCNDERLAQTAGGIEGYEHFRTARHRLGLATIYRPEDAKMGLRTAPPMEQRGASTGVTLRRPAGTRGRNGASRFSASA